MFLFVSRAKALRSWAGVHRVEDTPTGPQRILRPPRVRAIERFLNRDDRNTVPTTILLAFRPGTTEFSPLDDTLAPCVGDTDTHNDCEDSVDWGLLRFEFEPGAPEQDRPALIVDGQHRVEGFTSLSGDLPVLAVALLDADSEEQAFQFIVINNKATRVPADNVKAIIADLDEADLSDRLLEVGIRYGEVSPILRDSDELEESPFRGLLDWPRNPDADRRLIPLTAIEQMLRHVAAVFGRPLEEDEQSQLALLFLIWGVVRNQFDDLWGKKNMFMKKVCMAALNEFVLSRLKTLWELGVVDIFESQQVKSQVLKMLQLLPFEFWEASWNVSVQDNANVRRRIKEDLEQLAENTKLEQPWSTGLTLVDDPT